MTGCLGISCLSKRFHVIAILALALIVRMTFILVYTNIPTATDTSDYVTVAESLLEGRGFPDVENPPLYPLFLAGTFFLFGKSYMAVRLIQAVINSLTCVVIFYVGRMVFDKRVGFWSAFTLAFYPFHVWYTGLILTEVLYSFLIALFTLELIKAVKFVHYRAFATAGILLGVSALCRPTSLLLPLFVLPLMLLMLRKYSVSAVLKRLSIFIFFCLLVLTPWTVRNYIEYHRIIPVTSSSGHTLYSSLHELELRQNDRTKTKLRENVNEILSGTSFQIEQNDIFLEMSVKKIMDAPGRFIKDVLLKSLMFWYATSSGKRELGVLIIQMCILLPAVIGLGIAVVKYRNALIIPMIMVICYFLAVHSVFVPRLRHAQVVMPYVIILACFGIQDGIRLAFKR